MAAANGFVTISPDARYGDVEGAYSTTYTFATKFVVPGSGLQNVIEIGLWTWSNVAKGYHLSIFTHDAGNDCPEVIVADSDTGEIDAPGSLAKTFHTYSPQPQVTGGQTYWIMLTSEGESRPSRFASGGATVYKTGSSYPTWFTGDVWHSHTDQTVDTSFYAVYEAAGGVSVLPTIMLQHDHLAGGTELSRQITKGTIDVSVVIRIIDETDGTPEQAVEHDTGGIDLWYRREGATRTAIVEAALGGLNAAHADGGIEHIDDGYYRLDLPDGACAAGVDGVMIGGAVTGMIVLGTYIELTDLDLYDGVRAGLTALPNAAANAAGGLPISAGGALALDTQLANTHEITAARMGALTDWLNAGRLDAILDIIAADVVNINGDAMRGTNGANTTTPPTVAQIQAEMEENGLSILDTLRDDLANGGRLDLLIDAIKAATDNLPADPADDSDIDTQLVAIAAYIDTEIAAIKAVTDNLPDAGALNDLAAILTDTDELQIDDYPASIAAIKAETALIVADTNELQTDDTPAALAAIDAKIDIIDTNVDDVETVVVTNAAGADIAADIIEIKTETATLETRLSAVRAGYLDELAAANIPADVDTLLTRLSAARAGDLDELAAANLPADIDTLLTRVTGAVALAADLAALNDISPAQVNAEVVDGLNVDTYAEPPQGIPPETASIVAKLGFLHKLARNRKTTTTTQESLYNDDAVTIDHKAALSDDGVTFDKKEVVSGP